MTELSPTSDPKRAADAAGKILVLRGGAMGDFIITLPVLTALRTQYPGKRLEILGYPQIACLAVVAGLAESVHPIESPTLAAFFTPEATLDAAWQGWFGEASLIVSFVHDPQGIFHANIRRCTAAPILQGVPRPADGCGRHAADVLLDVLPERPCPTPILPPIPVDPWPLPKGIWWLAAHPGSGSARKNWPESAWSQLLLAWLRWTDGGVVLIGGEAESDRLQRLAATLRTQAGDSRVICLNREPLPTVARYLKSCQAFLGHDSGITHLAAACGLPGRALWGETDATVWRPLSETLRVFPAPEGLARLPVETVWLELLHLRQTIGELSPPIAVKKPEGCVLVIGYGNTLRRDDGAGVLVADTLSQWPLRGVQGLTAHQLTPEMAEPISRAHAVIFIDARVDVQPDARPQCHALEAVNASKIEPHLTTPEGLLRLAGELYDRTPPGWMITIPATDLAFGEGLSATTQAQIRPALELVLSILRHLPANPV